MPPLLRCSLCKKWKSPPLYLCRRHHDVCKKCNSRHNECPKCRTSIVDRRGYKLKMLEGRKKSTFNCKYDRCNFDGNRRDVIKHERECGHRKYACPLAVDCDWYDTSEEFGEHAIESHGASVIALEENQFEFTVLEKEASDAVFVFDEYRPVYFVVRLEEDAESLIVRVRFVGPPSISDRYNYELKLRDSNETQWISVVERPPRMEDRHHSRRESEGENEDVRVSLKLIESLCVDWWAFTVFKRDN